MAFIELTTRNDHLKTAINIDHILRFGAYLEDGQVAGSYIVMTVDIGEGNGKSWLRVSEPPSFIEDRLVGARIPLIR